MRLVFVADLVPDELAVIVEFLNAQMSHRQMASRSRSGSTSEAMAARLCPE